MSLLASAKPAANTTEVAYATPDSRRAVININCCNVGVSTSTVRLAISADATPADAQWIEWDISLEPSGVLERTGIALATGQKVFVRSQTGTITFNVWGIEEIA